MRKILNWLKNNYLILIALLLLSIFISSIWDKNFHIGGDNVLPLNPLDNIEKSIYVWESWNQGISQWRYTYLLWQLPFYFLAFVGVPPYAGIKIFIIGILISGLIFTYLFFRALFRGTEYDRKDLAFFSSFIFILSAAQLQILPTVVFLSALPLCSYFVIKYLDTGKFSQIIFFAAAISYAYLGQLPQAKLLFVFWGNLFFILLLYKQLRRVSFLKIISGLFILSFFSLLLNAFLLIPFVYEAFKSGGSYAYYTQNISVYNGVGDVPTASLPYIFRFFPSSLIDPVSHYGKFLGGFLFSLWTFILWAIALLAVFLVKNKKEKRVIYLLLLGTLAFIFLGKGANPPFGEIYKFLLFNVPVFKVFRTTSTAVIGAVPFFALGVSLAVYYLTKKWPRAFFLILFIHIVVFYPVYFGYKLITADEKGQMQKGYLIPDEYYQMGKKLDGIEEDLKILSLPLDESYSYKDWSYMGQPIMAYLTRKPFIHGQVFGYSGFTDNLILQRMNRQESCYWLAVNNIGYLLKEKDSRVADYSLEKFNFSGTSVLENSYFNLEKVKPECFLPHIYAAADILSFTGERNSIPNASRFLKSKEEVIIEENLAEASVVIQASAEQARDLSDSNATKKVFSEITGTGPLNFWTYSFNVFQEGSYQMVIDNRGIISQKAIFLKKGKNTVKIPVWRKKNLIDLNLFAEGAPLLQVITDWGGENFYLIFLKYRLINPGSLSLTFDEVKRNFAGRLPFYDLNAVLFSKEMIGQKPGIYEYQVLLKSDINAQQAAATIKKVGGNILIEDFRIEEVSLPKVFFVNLKEQKKTIPEITFTKVDPTKYYVDVKNAVGPYYLVFSESFSPDWKISGLTNTRHFIVNGFANGWRINLSDSGGKKDYRLTIEYWPQRLFYLGVIISFLTGIFCLLVSVKQRIR